MMPRFKIQKRKFLGDAKIDFGVTICRNEVRHLPKPKIFRKLIKPTKHDQQLPKKRNAIPV